MVEQLIADHLHIDASIINDDSKRFSREFTEIDN